MFRLWTSAKTLCFLCLMPIQSPGQDTSGTIFSFDQDIRVFTAQACQNAAGYDHEWRKEGMHPLRTAIRSEMRRSLDSSFVKQLRAFREACRGDWSSWASYALLTDGPPDFGLSYDPKTTPYGDRTRDDMPGLSAVLADFYVKAHVPELWRKYRPQFQELSDRFRPHAQRALDDITQYCRLDKDYFSRRASRIHVVFAPMQSYFTAFTEKVGDEIYLIFGPQVSDPSPSSFYHEALHHVISPLTEKLDSTVTSRFSQLFALATSEGHIGYGHIDEAFVRTLDCVISGRRLGWSDSTIAANVTHEYKFGFILCLAIYEQMKDYEASQMTFPQFFPRMIARIDTEREKQRWREVTQNAK